MHRGILALALVAVAGCDDAPATGDALAEQQAERGWGSDRCPALPEGATSGYLLGQQLAELSFIDCDGNSFDVREVCGADVVWLSLAHTWCPHCQENARIMEELHQDLVEDGVDIASLNILVENGDFEPPDADLCSEWREEYEQSAVLTFYDPTRASFVLWEENFTALNVLLDRNRLIRAKIHTDVADDIREAVDFVLR